MLQLIDTHCHIHSHDYPLDSPAVIKHAAEQGVNKLLLVGCTLPDSQAAIIMAAEYNNLWATIGLHPHEATVYVNNDHALQQFRDLVTQPKVVAIGETGLDYHYNHSTPDDQKKLLRFQLDLAVEHDLPLIFHVREAYEDFWAILADYPGIRGVVHSFSAGAKELDQILAYGLYVGLNGIMTFTKDQGQLQAAKAIPLDKMLLETDSPFLTPTPFRGKIGEPKYVRTVAEFLASLRGESLEELARATTVNARTLFGM